MFKKNYFYLSITIIAAVCDAIQLMFFPELTPLWFIRLVGGLFIMYAIGYALDIQKIYLQKKIDKLNSQIKNFKNK